MSDIVALGELLVDFTENGISEQGNRIFEANPGGAPCNVLAMLQKLGNKTAFIGKVGSDQFGVMLKQTLDKVGIDASNLLMDDEVNTTLAFVHTAKDGERDFSFYRNPGADMMLREDEVSEGLIKNAKVFHFGTLSMTDVLARNATKKAIQLAQKYKLCISFDPNLRRPLWSSLDEAKKYMEYGLSLCDMVKMSEEELEFITGESNVNKGVEYLQEKFPIKLICITMGKLGSKAFYRQWAIHEGAYIQQETIETTGAGDTFCACMIHTVLEQGLDMLDDIKLKKMLIFANAAASLITTKRGALCVMPTKQEIMEFISSEACKRR